MTPPVSHSGRPAVFLDRDGTLIEDRGDVRSPADVAWYPDTVPALRALGIGHDLFIVTQQSGVAQGRLTAAEVRAVNDHVVERLAEAGVRIRAVYCCMHGPEDGCACRKPDPGPLRRAARDFGVDLSRSFVVGDHPHDVELARRAGAKGLYLRTGHGEKHRDELPLDVTAILPGIREAAEWILASWAAEERSENLAAETVRAADILRRGGVVAFPTETVYGLGADARNDEAVARIFEIKGRPRFDPLIVHVSEPGMAEAVAAEIPPPARELIRRFWPGPLTLVLNKRPEVSDLVTAGLPTVGVRMPRHPLALDLIHRAGVPVAAPSANPFGRTSPTRAAHVTSLLGDAVAAVLDGGPCAVGVESTILSLAAGEPMVLRTGGLAVEEIEAVIGPVRMAPPADDVPLAPGRLLRHYAPQTRLVLEETAAAVRGDPRAGLLCFKGHPEEAKFGAVEVLSRAGDVREAAAHLFAALRRLDAQGLDVIHAERVPDRGLGRAINDRLRRAAR
ncbi:MAG: threonylcarbamoyl-AMP synthase [Lentisphaerae bacterium]|nr:threonylcarbamoyl-AMP synthase [Lentisphaerota bacterium]